MIKKTLSLATFLCLAISSLAMASWEPIYGENDFDVEPVAVESYEMGGITWNHFVANREDWNLEDAIGFEIDMPDGEDGGCSGDWNIHPETEKSFLGELYFWMEKNLEDDEGPVFGCSVVIDRVETWNHDFDLLVQACIDCDWLKMIQSKRLDNHPHFVGYIDLQDEELLFACHDVVPATTRLYLGKKGEMYELTTTLKNPLLVKHFFDSFKLLEQ